MTPSDFYKKFEQSINTVAKEIDKNLQEGAGNA